MSKLGRQFTFWICLMPLSDATLMAQFLELKTTAALGSTNFAESAEALDLSYAFHKRVDEVRVSFYATDRHGHPVSGLRSEDVVVKNDGRTVANLVSFSDAADFPQRVTLLVDLSGSMGELQLLRFRSVAWKAEDWMTFSARLSSLAPASAEDLRTDGRTAMLDALSTAMRRQPCGEQRHNRRAILLLSDGEDNLSRHTLREVVAEAQRADIAIYTVVAHSQRLRFPGDQVLRSLSEETGGRLFLFPDYSRLDKVLARMKSDLRSTYAISFRPEADGKAEGLHSIEIQIRRHRPQVHAKKGYMIEAPN